VRLDCINGREGEVTEKSAEAVPRNLLHDAMVGGSGI
jgi:hypothetical protein